MLRRRFERGGGTINGNLTAATYTATVASGSNAFLLTSGAYMNLGGNGWIRTNSSTIDVGDAGKTLNILGTGLSLANAATGAKISLAATDSTGTPGASTINKASGQVSIAAGASSVVVTNSLVTTASVVFAVLQFADSTLNTLRSVVPGPGSFTITGNANATAATKVGFVVFN